MGSVGFVTLADKASMPCVNSRMFSCPWTKDLRMDKALGRLTWPSLGMFSGVLCKHTGALVCTVVP